MKLNIVTNNPDKVLAALQEACPVSHINHTEVRTGIHNFEFVNEGEPMVYSVDALIEIAHIIGISTYNIRIY